METSTTEQDIPHRKHCFNINIELDNLKDLRHVLNQLHEQSIRNVESFPCQYQSDDITYSVLREDNPNMDNAKYWNALNNFKIMNEKKQMPQ